MTSKTIEYKGISIQNEIELPVSPIGVPVNFSLTGRNTTDKSLKVRILPTCGCTTADRKEFNVGPNEPFSAEVQYTTTSKVGAYSKRVHVYFGENNTSDESQKITVTFKGEIK